MPVFFNLFAAADPYANVCVAHGTLCNDPSVIATTIRTVVANFIPGKFGLFRRKPWQALAEPWGSAEPRLKNTSLCRRY